MVADTEPRWQQLGFPDEASYQRSGAADFDAKVPPTPGDDAARARKKKEQNTKPAKAATDGPAASIVSLAAARQDTWLDKLQRSDRGFKANDFNVTVALNNAPELVGKIAWDRRQLTYAALTETPAGPAGRWSDSHTAQLAVWLQSLTIPITMRHVETALAAVARRNEVDPLGEYLNGLRWDGEERLATWLADYCEAERSEANGIIGAKFMIGAVARALRPGCQMDHMLVLEGDQGQRKSAAIRILGGDYAGENLPDFHSKDAMQIIGCKWIVEVSELAAIGKSQLEAIKAFITRREDTFRPPYGKHPLTVPRWSVLIGNYNPDGVGILQDTTGGRRFWVVAVGKINTEALAYNRDDLWAEAVVCFKRGDRWWPDKDQEIPIAVQQELRRDTDDWLELIERWIGIDGQTGYDLPTLRSEFTTAEVAVQCLGFVSRDINRTDQMRISKCLKQLGYHRIKKWGKVTQRNVYVRNK